jgi:hypothetical protein
VAAGRPQADRAATVRERWIVIVRKPPSKQSRDHKGAVDGDRREAAVETEPRPWGRNRAATIRERWILIVRRNVRIHRFLTVAAPNGTNLPLMPLRLRWMARLRRILRSTAP